MQEKDYTVAVTVLTAGVEFAYLAGANYTRLLFMLSKTMVRQNRPKEEEVHFLNRLDLCCRFC